MNDQTPRKAIITAAVTGAIHTPAMSPHLPLTPQQLVDDIMSVYEAGGAVAHLHVREPQTGQPKADQAIFKEVVTEVKRRCDIVICATTGGSLGDTVENRGRVVTTLKPELASLNAGSMNFGLFHVVSKFADRWKYDWEEKYLSGTEDFIFPNTFYTIRKFTELMSQYGTKPEFEIYDVGMINNLAYLIDTGKIKTPVYLQFVLGILGGIPATVDNLIYLVRTAQKQIGDFEWSVCAAGRSQFAIPTPCLWEAMRGSVWRTTFTWERAFWPRAAVSRWPRSGASPPSLTWKRRHLPRPGRSSGSKDWIRWATKAHSKIASRSNRLFVM